MNGPSILDLRSPRTLQELFATSLRLYARHFALWLLLAALLVVPFQIIVLLITAGVHGAKLSSAQRQQAILLDVADFIVVISLVSALQAHAVALLGQGERPRLGEILRRLLPVMPTVIAASIITAIGVAIGLVLFVLPGLWLLLRLYVVAQTAAIERTDWPTTLRRAYDLTRRNFWHILGVLLIVGLINLTLDIAASALTNSGASAVQDVVAVVVALVSQSFTALLSALLYFDLRAREGTTAGALRW